jgi:glutathione S-transferase
MLRESGASSNPCAIDETDACAHVGVPWLLARPVKPGDDTGGRNESQTRRVISRRMSRMLTLYSYPELFGVADNNPFGLKIFAFLKLVGLPFRHEHIFDAKAAPRGQLPYIDDDGEHVGDSDTIIAYLTRKYRLTIDDALTGTQRNTDLMVRRTLDDLYWVMSYSRWKDPQFWPLFRNAMLSAHPSLTLDGMDAARTYNFERYRYQGIGRYQPEDVYKRGIADLAAVASLIGAHGFVFGPQPTSIDAGVYGFVANIYFYDIDTPLRQFVASHKELVRHCSAIHAMVT